jgi:hypothetical protein
MELNRIETLLEKYFQGETSVLEEKELKNLMRYHENSPLSISVESK